MMYVIRLQSLTVCKTMESIFTKHGMVFGNFNRKLSLQRKHSFHTELGPSLSQRLALPATRQRKRDCFATGSRKYSPGTRCSAEDSSSTTVSTSAAYIHLPFCRRRCHYCDFAVVATGERNRPHWEEVMSGYVDTVLQEIDLTPQMGGSTGAATGLRSVFFGGGTPSLVPPSQVERILVALDRKFGIQPEAEISMEMDPGTFSLPQLRDTVALGVNRVSLGVQSFDESALRECGRSHGLAEVHEALEMMHSTPDLNWSLDLISSLPHQTEESWGMSLDAAIAANPYHISIYDLQIEAGTAFGRLFSPGMEPLPSDAQAAAMYCQASKRLAQAGYNHYEVSNYAKEGFQCQHNLVYWRNQPYYAFGMAAASYMNRLRFTRPNKMSKYKEWVQNGAIIGLGDPDYEQSSSQEDEILDTLMLGLRLADGVDIQAFERNFGVDTTRTVLSNLAAKGPRLVTMFDCQGEEINSASNINSVQKVRLTDPEGFLISNDIISSLFVDLS